MYKKEYSKQDALNSLNLIMRRVPLSTVQSKHLFRYVYQNDSKGYLFSLLTAAIHTKGETVDELVGIIKATQSLMPRIRIQGEVTDTSGTGGGQFKSLNVSTAAAFVLAAAGHKVIKACYRGITGSMGSADLMMNFGIDVFKLNSQAVVSLCHKVGISPYFSITISPKLSNRAALSRKVFLEEGMKIRTPYHLSTHLCTPCQMSKRIYGCYDQKDVMTLASVFRRLGYKHTLTFSAEIGMPELSNVGKTYLVEQKGNSLKEYLLAPEDLGVVARQRQEIAFVSDKQSCKDFTHVLKNTASQAKRDLVALNAGAALYVMENLSSIKVGVIKAQKILGSGKAHEIFAYLRKECLQLQVY